MVSPRPGNLMTTPDACLMAEQRFVDPRRGGHNRTNPVVGNAHIVWGGQARAAQVAAQVAGQMAGRIHMTPVRSCPAASVDTGAARC